VLCVLFTVFILGVGVFTVLPTSLLKIIIMFRRTDVIIVQKIPLLKAFVTFTIEITCSWLLDCGS
jgi:hypothetical protein